MDKKTEIGKDRLDIETLTTAAKKQISVRLCPSAEFEGGVEQFHLERGLPIRAEVTLNGRVVSVTEYENGSPITQRLDLNLDGYMDTVRRFCRITAGARDSLGADELLDFKPPLESVENIR